jgi:hypothetical protein
MVLRHVTVATRNGFINAKVADSKRAAIALIVRRLETTITRSIIRAIGFLAGAVGENWVSTTGNQP